MQLTLLKNLSKTLWLLTSGVFVVNCSSFLVLPFWGIYLIKNLGFSVVMAGLIISLNFLAQRGFSLVGGILTDLFNAKIILVLGLFFRSLAYLGLGLSHQYNYIFLCSLTMGFGSALYSPASKTALLFFAGESQRKACFLLRSAAMNMGVAIGPLFGLALFNYSPKSIFLSAFLVHAIFCWLSLNFIPNSFAKIKMQLLNKSKLIALLEPLKNCQLFSLSMTMLLFMVAYIQIDLTIPLYAKHLFNNSGVSIFFLINAVLACALSMTLSIYLLNRFDSAQVMYSGLLLLSLAFISSSLNSSATLLILSTIALTIAEVIFFPSMDIVLSRLFPAHTSGTAFGFLDFFAAIGGIIGNLLGSYLYSQLALLDHLNWYWAFIGILIASYFLLLVSLRIFLKRRKQRLIMIQ